MRSGARSPPGSLALKDTSISPCTGHLFPSRVPGRSPWSLPHAAGSQLVTNSLASLGCCPLPGGSISWPTQYGLLSGLFASSKLAPGSTWGAHQPQLSPVPPPAAGKVSPPGAGSDTPLWAAGLTLSLFQPPSDLRPPSSWLPPGCLNPKLGSSLNSFQLATRPIASPSPK